MRNPFQPPSVVYPQQSSSIPYYPVGASSIIHHPTVSSKIVQPETRMVRPVQPADRVFTPNVLQPVSKIQASQLIANPPKNVAVGYGKADEDEDL